MLNFNEDNNFIIINEKAFVPGKGKGPFVKPFIATGSQIRLFRRLGLQVTIVDEDYEYPSDENNKKTDKKVEEKESTKEDTNKETEEETSTPIDDTEEEKVEEKVEEKEETSEEEINEDDLSEFTVAELKEELDSKDIEYASNARKQDLIELLQENSK